MAGHGRTSTRTSEFPILDRYGLYSCANTRGDGNCLFNALSDQLYGHQNNNLLLRAATIAHMKKHSDFYRQYMVIKPVRRNPGRSSKSRPSSSLVDVSFHTEEELQKQFEEHLEKMGQPGEWADNMEVCAFASALNVHVRIWQAEFEYTIEPRAWPGYEAPDLGNDDLPILNIAYHNWEHYSSVRNIKGPHTGPPEVSVEIRPPQSKKRTSVERDGGEAEVVDRAAKRRSPLPLCDSDTTPDPSESSSDESQQTQPTSSQHDSSDESEHEHDKPSLSQQPELPQVLPKLKLILKLKPRSAPSTDSSIPS